MRTRPYTQNRKQQRKAGVTVPDQDHPLSAMENQPATLHCDVCEGGVILHTLWRSMTGFPVSVRCWRHVDKGEL